MPGVVSITNRIKVAPERNGADVTHRIVEALRRTADITARDIAVTVDGGVVTLCGAVPSWAQREAAERTAAAAPGTTHVNNLIVVVTPPTNGVDEQC